MGANLVQGDDKITWRAELDRVTDLAPEKKGRINLLNS